MTFAGRKYPKARGKYALVRRTRRYADFRVPAIKCWVPPIDPLGLRGQALFRRDDDAPGRRPERPQRSRAAHAPPVVDGRRREVETPWAQRHHPTLFMSSSCPSTPCRSLDHPGACASHRKPASEERPIRSTNISLRPRGRAFPSRRPPRRGDARRLSQAAHLIVEVLPDGWRRRRRTRRGSSGRSTPCSTRRPGPRGGRAP